MEYKDTIFLPKSSFEMRANLPTKEPKILEEWDKEKIFYKLREKSKGYISYLRGENPITFPYRLYPKENRINNSSKKRNPKKLIKKFKIESSRLNSEGLSSVEIANGHDINRILVSLLELDHPREAEFWVRDNLNLGDISETQIIKKIRDWEQSNPPFNILLE